MTFKKEWLAAAMLAAFLVSPVSAVAAEKTGQVAADEEQGNIGRSVTLAGVVTGDYQLKGDDGVVYEIADTMAGNDVLQKVGARVRIQGTVFADGAYRVLVVESFRAEAR